MKVNQVVSQQPIFSFKAKFPDEHNNNIRGVGRFTDATHNWKLQCRRV